MKCKYNSSRDSSMLVRPVRDTYAWFVAIMAREEGLRGAAESCQVFPFGFVLCNIVDVLLDTLVVDEPFCENGNKTQ